MTTSQEIRLTEYQQFVKKDFKLSEEALDLDSLATAALHAKYLGFWSNEKRELAKLRKQLKNMQALKYEYYSGRMDAETHKQLGWAPYPHKILKTETWKYVGKDPDIVSAEEIIEIQEAIVEYLKEAVRGVSDFRWSIRNAVEYRKFLHGNG